MGNPVHSWFANNALINSVNTQGTESPICAVIANPTHVQPTRYTCNTISQQETLNKKATLRDEPPVCLIAGERVILTTKEVPLTYLLVVTVGA